MNDATVSNKNFLTYEFYFKQPMQLVELIKNMIIDIILNLIYALDRSVNYPLIRNYSKFAEEY